MCPTPAGSDRHQSCSPILPPRKLRLEDKRLARAVSPAVAAPGRALASLTHPRQSLLCRLFMKPSPPTRNQAP